jgi:bifunctional DNase/RNase
MSDVRVRAWRIGQGSDSQYMLILRDGSHNLLPMVIGPCEALAIWGVMDGQGAEASGATTHDLLRDLIEGLGGRLTKVLIDDLWNGVYYARLHFSIDGEVLTVDARPSDAVAVALRMEAPLFATQSVMTSALEPEALGDPGTMDSEEGAGAGDS